MDTPQDISFHYEHKWECDRPQVSQVSAVEKQRLIVEQLRREAAIQRINVSQAVEDILKFIEEHRQEDCLICGFSNRANVLRDTPCNVT